MIYHLYSIKVLQKCNFIILIRSRRSYGKWILQKILGTTTQNLFEDSPKAKKKVEEEKNETFL